MENYDAFSLPHTVGYSVIALQELNLFNRFPSIYWNTGCLIVNSGGSGSGTDYAKIAVALSRVIHHGTEVSTVDINKSESGFIPDAENNKIMYGFKSLDSISDEFIKGIVDNRPYSGIEDFLSKNKTNISQMSSLIKSGAFDDLEGGRELSLAKYSMLRTGYRKSIAITILPALKKHNLLPEEMENQYAIYEFNRFVKKVLKKEDGYYVFNDRALDFFMKNFDASMLDFTSEGKEVLKIKVWERLYKNGMDPAREWLKKNEEDIFKLMFLFESLEVYNKIGEGSVSKWEMDSMSFYHGEHELANVNFKKYGIVDFEDLEEDSTRIRNGRFTRYETSSIVGTCLSRNKTKGEVYILTPQGKVVLMKLYKSKFNHYDKRISELNPATGKKKILENSWFSKGNKIYAHGFRRGNQFIPRTYEDTPVPSIALITEVLENGEIELKTERGK